MNWGALRVWNDDEIAANSGFPPHGHRDMEIITYVRDGAITHKDSLGNMGRTGAGDVQVMSAGSGVQHAEYNLESDLTRLFQIWIEPDAPGGAPAWGAKPFPKGDRSGKFVTLASSGASGRPGDTRTPRSLPLQDPRQRPCAGRNPEGRRDGDLSHGSRPARLSGVGRRQGGRQRRAA